MSCRQKVDLRRNHKGKDLAVLLGHADISTTGIYVKADMASRVAAVLGVEAAV